jgi:hypothetical protein
MEVRGTGVHNDAALERADHRHRSSIVLRRGYGGSAKGPSLVASSHGRFTVSSFGIDREQPESVRGGDTSRVHLRQGTRRHAGCRLLPPHRDSDAEARRFRDDLLTTEHQENRVIWPRRTRSKLLTGWASCASRLGVVAPDRQHMEYICRPASNRLTLAKKRQWGYTPASGENT